MMSGWMHVNLTEALGVRARLPAADRALRAALPKP